jgi:hypothetical protein
MRNGQIHVLAFVSEILSAKTLVPILDAIGRDPEFTVRIVNDGFCLEFVRSLGLPVEYILDDFESRIDAEVRAASLVLTGKSYVQPSEYALLRSAASRGAPVLMVVPDMGIDVVRAKLRGIGGGPPDGIPYPRLLLADERTRESLRGSGIPEDRIVEFGNPYFDQLYDELRRDWSDWRQVGAGYFSTPFELDFDRGILPAAYRQKDLIADIRRACANLGLPLTAKRHPQVEPALFQGMRMFDGTPLEMIRTIRVAVGSYSTTLLEAYAAGIPAVSYQPWEANIRADVFEGRIPIVKSRSQMEEALRIALSGPCGRAAPRYVTYNPGASLEVALGLVRDLAGALRIGVVR